MSNSFSREELESWKKWADKNSKSKLTNREVNQSTNRWEAINDFRAKNRKSSCSSCQRRRYL